MPHSRSQTPRKPNNTHNKSTLGSIELWPNPHAPKQAEGVASRYDKENRCRESGNSPEKAKQRAIELRRSKFADQRTAARLWRSFNPDFKASKAAGRGVTACGWSLRAQSTAKLVRIETERGPKAFYRGLMVCGLRWVCPCCTAAKSEESKKQLNAALAQGRQTGLVPVMLTLTARHSKKMALAKFWETLSTAEKKMKKRRQWKALNKRLPGGFAKAVEVTYGKNGWHPHLHIILLTDGADEAEALELVEALREIWLEELEKVGLDGHSTAAKKRSFDVRSAATAAEYVAKWGAAEEMTLSGSKVGRAEGRTPWQLLREAREAETEKERMFAGALWYEFIQVFKGVHQLRKSPKFSETVKKYRATNPEEEDEPDENTLIHLDDASWTFGRWRRVRILEAGEHPDIDQAKRDALAELMAEGTDADLDDDPGPLIDPDD